jgi:hypothetical protein
MICFVLACFFIIAIPVDGFDSVEISAYATSSAITINLEPYSIVYEGDVILCNFTSEPTEKYWQINNQSKHTLFYENNPVLFDPEPTPLEDTFVNLTISAYISNTFESITIPIQLKRIYWGDIHWHSSFSDGSNDLDMMYKNAIRDKYIDFASCTDHGELIDGINTYYKGFPRFSWLRDKDTLLTIIEKFQGFSEWDEIKHKTNEYYYPGNFSTILGFEWTGGEWSIGGHPLSPNGFNDVSHINFYYKNVYPQADEYSDFSQLNYEQIFTVMSCEWDLGHYNIGYPHHPQSKVGNMSFTVNWTYLANNIKNEQARDTILRGVELNSRWGTAIGQYFTPDLPWLHPYPDIQFYNQTESWIENALWEWSKPAFKGKPFGFIGSSDTHLFNRPSSALSEDSYFGSISGIMGAYATHNTRGEIWDAMNNGSTYASQLFKIRANICVNDKHEISQWINSTNPLKIRVSALAINTAIDNTGKSNYPYGYESTNKNWTISDIWVIKKDTNRGQPWCKVIGHTTPNSILAVETFYDDSVQSNDFYWVAIRQLEDTNSNEKEEYMTYLGPIFINQVI